jgi:hypothetical protein
MSLESIADNTRTDKNTVHSYLPLYQTLLEGKRENAKHVLEVGIFDGGSIKMWHDFFPNAIVYGVDVMTMDTVWDELKNKERIKLCASTDAYSADFVKKFVDQKIKFDVLLDDGPHTLESMKSFIKLYSEVMAENGILIIEDVQDFQWIRILRKEVPHSLKKFIKIYDLRENKKRYDDLVFTIDKSGVPT